MLSVLLRRGPVALIVLLVAVQLVPYGRAHEPGRARGARLGQPADPLVGRLGLLRLPQQ
jgi:hypothetical protein